MDRKLDRQEIRSVAGMSFFSVGNAGNTETEFADKAWIDRIAESPD